MTPVPRPRSAVPWLAALLLAFASGLHAKDLDRDSTDNSFQGDLETLTRTIGESKKSLQFKDLSKGHYVLGEYSNKLGHPLGFDELTDAVWLTARDGALDLDAGRAEVRRRIREKEGRSGPKAKLHKDEESGRTLLRISRSWDTVPVPEEKRKNLLLVLDEPRKGFSKYVFFQDGKVEQPFPMNTFRGNSWRIVSLSKGVLIAEHGAFDLANWHEPRGVDTWTFALDEDGFARKLRVSGPAAELWIDEKDLNPESGRFDEIVAAVNEVYYEYP